METLVHPNQLFLTFQGGFAATRVAVYTANNTLRDSEWTLRKYVYPEDVNRKQQFDLVVQADLEPNAQASNEETNGETLRADMGAPVAQIKLVFEQSSDFFGRITLYDLDVHGTAIP